jgi:chemotaxis protein MotB
MAVLLLVFVLVLVSSLYHYYQALGTKTADLEQKAALMTVQQQQLSEQQQQLSEQQQQLSEQQQQLNDQQAKLLVQKAVLDAQQTTLNAQQTALESQKAELDEALTAIQSQQGLLDAQNETLTQQEATIATAQAALADKETALAATQAALDVQKRKLDDLVGVRTKIIRDLSAELTKASIKASVDAKTGDIMLSSSVFFDIDKFVIKDEGKQFLDQFIPLYLDVLLSEENAAYLGEIMIEGHTDSQGTYLHNLELSQNRALAVAKYCLDIKTLTPHERKTLQGLLTAKGRSYSDLVNTAGGKEDRDASRRVEFKFRLKDSEMIDAMRQILSGEQ